MNVSPNGRELGRALTMKGKCPRAFHVTCARDDEQVVHRVWEVEDYVPVPIPEDAPEGTQHEFVKERTLKTETLCPTHNPVCLALPLECRLTDRQSRNSRRFRLPIS